MNKFKLYFFFCFLFFSTNVWAQTPRTLLWKIEGKDLEKPSYLYGTMHSGNDKVYELMDSVLIAFKSTDFYAMEINPDSIDKKAIASEMILPDGMSLKQMLTTEQYKATAKIFKKSTGFPLLLFNRIKPLYVYLMMVEGKKAKKGTEALDLFFFKLANKQNKKVFGLEKAEDQLKLLAGIDVQEQKRMLIEGVESIQNKKDSSTTDLFQDYRNADLDKLLKEATADTSMGVDFVNVFIYDRNVIMVNHIDQLLKKGSFFVAIGAAHLPGEKGVIEGLKSKGYKVSPVFSDNYRSAKSVRKELKK